MAKENGSSVCSRSCSLLSGFNKRHKGSKSGRNKDGGNAVVRREDLLFLCLGEVSLNLLTLRRLSHKVLFNWNSYVAMGMSTVSFSFWLGVVPKNLALSKTFLFRLFGYQERTTYLAKLVLSAK